MSDTRTPAEIAYDRTRLSPLNQADTLLRAVLAPPAEMPEVNEITWQSEDGVSYTDFHAGAGLTRVMIGTYGSDKAGLELIVGGRPINEHLDEVLTLADVRQLRDNLDALLSDARLLAAVE
jgi:hypothetical protein